MMHCTRLHAGAVFAAPHILRDLTSSLCTSVKRPVPPPPSPPFTDPSSSSSPPSAAAFSPAVVLSDASREQCVRALGELKPLRGPGAAQAKELRKAAVLVALCEVDGAVSLLYTLRSPNLASYRGQVSFPGGMMEASDAGSVEKAALREAHEELGLEPSRVRVWGAGPFVGTSRRDAVVVPVVGSVGRVDVAQLRCCPEEVACAFAVPLQRLCDPRFCKYTRFQSGYVLPVFDSAEHRIWGLTAIITHMVLKALMPYSYSHQLPYMK